MTSDRDPLRPILIALELLLAVSALGGGGGLCLAPDGSLLGLAPELLAGTPFPDYRIPGLTLLALNCALPTMVAIAALRRRPWARLGHVAVGLALVGWIAGQVAFIGAVDPLQAILGGYGLVITALGLAAARRQPAPPAW